MGKIGDNGRQLSLILYAAKIDVQQIAILFPVGNENGPPFPTLMPKKTAVRLQLPQVRNYFPPNPEILHQAALCDESGAGG